MIGSVMYARLHRGVALPLQPDCSGHGQNWEQRLLGGGGSDTARYTDLESFIERGCVKVGNEVFGVGDLAVVQGGLITTIELAAS